MSVSISMKENDYRNRFLCKSCKKMLISKEALDNHIILCYESRLENLREEIKKIKIEYEKKIDDITEYMINHVNIIEEKHNKLTSYLMSQIQKLSSL